MNFSRIALVAATASTVAAGSALAQGGQRQTNFFRQIASYGVDGGIAEIVDVSGDGNVLAFSDADAGRIGFVSIADPSNPVALPDVALRPTYGADVEPTSVSFAGNLAVAAVLTTPWSDGNPAPDPTDPNNAGALVVINVSNPRMPAVLGSIPIGFQPDSVKLLQTDRGFVAIVCIENEPVVVDANGIVLDEDIPGFARAGSGQFPQDISEPGFVQVITFNPRDLAAANVASVPLPETALQRAGLLFADDAQPEFVDVHGRLAAITLQENNGVVLIDISNPIRPRVQNIFSCGNAAERLCDLTEDDAISFTEGYPSSIGTSVAAPTDGSGNPVPGGPRQPDALAFTPDGSALVLADEGELNFTGGRGFSIFSTRGREIYGDAGALEFAAKAFGQYPEGRSENRGMEIEGVTTATFGRRNFAFVLSERGSFMGVYDIADLSVPVLMQILPTGISPEGVVAIPDRNLLVTADEGSGTLSIYRGQREVAPTPDQPQLYSQTSFSAISGLTGFQNGAFGIPDNALPTTIYWIRTGSPFADVVELLPVTRNGQQTRYDGEGIVRDRSILAVNRFLGGFFLASEGNGSSRPNLIVQTDIFGRVLREIQLPTNVDAAADPAIGGNAVGSAGGGTIRGNGFEGVTLSREGNYLFACIQRQFNGEAATHTRIARYDLRQIRDGNAPNDGTRFGGDWDFFFYPLEAAGDAGWIGLSEIVAFDRDRFLVIERDQGIGAEAALKTVHAVDLRGLTPDTDGQPGEANGDDVATKVLYEDVLDRFTPYEKVEGLAFIRGQLWVGLDNDGGELENRMVNLGRFRNPFRRR